MRDEVEVIVATTAFGMGIDKPNVRFVYHCDISDSIDSYYQEFGRAGRAGKPARAILFYHSEDLSVHRFFNGGGQLDLEQVERVAEAVQGHDRPVVLSELEAETHLSQSKLNAALTRLEEVGAIALDASGDITAGERSADLGAAVAAATEAQQRHHLFERSRLEMMRGYAEETNCRRGYVLNYFGQDMREPCGACDNCDAGRSVAEDESMQPFPLNARVAHTMWGEGLVMRYEGDTMTVLFDDIGYKTLAIALIAQQGLLTAAHDTR